MADTVWKNEEGRARLEAWYERFRARIPGPTESRLVKTAQGPSHVLLAGDASKPPLVCLHAMRTSAAHLMSELGPLLDHYYLIGPDLPVQSVRGPQVRLSLNDDSHVRWLTEVLDALNLGRVNLFGVSWGGFVARQVASLAPDRVHRLALLVPAGIVAGSNWQGFRQMFLPGLLYFIAPNQARLHRLLDPIFTTWDDDWAKYVGDTIHDLKIDSRIPPLATDEELRHLTVPTLVLAAEHDISFPADQLVKRVRELIPDVEAEVMAGSKHSPPMTEEFRQWLTKRLTSFFEKRT